MTRYILAVIFALIIAPAFGQTPDPSHPMPTDASGNAFSSSNPVPAEIVGGINIGSVTVDAFPVFADGAGNPATVTADASHRALVNLGSESIGLISAINAISGGSADTVATQVVALTGASEASITSGLPVGKTRQWVKISGPSYESEIWVSYNHAAVVGSCELYYGFAVIPVTEDVTIHVNASTAMNLYVVEGGK
jgi:hypothetical protein